jgi:hypothetical protein
MRRVTAPTVWFQSVKKQEGYDSSHLRQEDSNIRPYLPILADRPNDSKVKALRKSQILASVRVSLVRLKVKGCNFGL